SEPQEAVNSRPASSAEIIKGFTEDSILFEIACHSSTTLRAGSGRCAILFVYFIREIAFMARCEICDKGPIYGNRVSHAHNLTRRRWNPNLQRVRVIVGQVHKHLR